MLFCSSHSHSCSFLKSKWSCSSVIIPATLALSYTCGSQDIHTHTPQSRSTSWSPQESSLPQATSPGLLYSEMGPSCSTYTQVSTTVPLHCLCELQYCKRIVDCYRPEKPLVEQIHKLCPFMQHVSEDNDLLMLSYIETHMSIHAN